MNLLRKNQDQTKKVWLTSLGLVIGIMFLFSAPAEALYVGQSSQINPYLELQGIYESNVFQTNEDEESDFITVISPGVHAEFPTEEDALYRFLANYRANIKFYGNHEDSELDPDGELNTVEHRADAQIELNTAAGLKLSAGYVLNITSDPPDFVGDTRNEYTEHQPFAEASYAFVDRYELEVRYDGSIKGYDKSENQVDDITSNRVDATFYYRLFPSLSVLGGGGYAQVNREDPPYSDSTEMKGFGGVRFEMTARLTGTVKAGVLSKDFDNDQLDDTTEAYVSGELISDFTERTKLTLNVRREIEESSFGGSEAYNVVTGIQAAVVHTLAALENLTLNGSLSFIKEDYPKDPNDRSDDSLEVSAGADYKVHEYVTVGASFTHSSRDSNIDVNDYTNNIAMLVIRATM